MRWQEENQELFSCFPFRRINAAPLRAEANFRHFHPCLFTFSHFGGHTENIFLPTKLSRRRSLPLTRQGARSAQQEQDMIMNNNREEWQASNRGNYLFTYLNCQTSYAETDVHILFTTPVWFLLLDFCPGLLPVSGSEIFGRSWRLFWKKNLSFDSSGKRFTKKEN